MKTSEEMAKSVIKRIAQQKEIKKQRVKKTIKSVSAVMCIVLIVALVFSSGLFNNPAPTETVKPDSGYTSLYEDSADDNGYTEYDMPPIDLSTDNPDGEITLSYEYDISQSIEEMADKSDVIVKGYFDFDETPTPSSWNLCRDSEYISRESLDSKIEATLSKFVVTEVLKGDVPENITVSTRACDEIEYGDNYLSFEYPLFLWHEYQGEYILFLDKIEYFDYYTASTEPYCLRVKGDALFVESKLFTDNKHAQFVEVYEKVNHIGETKFNGEIVKINYNLPEIEDNFSGIMISELKEIINEP